MEKVEDWANLNMLAEKVLHSPIYPELLAYCPTLDLLALATNDEQVHVFRINGQKVFGVTAKDPTSKVTSMWWRPDGEIDCIGFLYFEIFL